VENRSRLEQKTPKKCKSIVSAVVLTVLILSVIGLILCFVHNEVPTEEAKISQIVSEPGNWENRTVKVTGTIEKIPIGIIQPFNYWLLDAQNRTIRIGLRCNSDADLSGRSITVEGIVKRGYAWVNPNYPGWWTYYIEASSVQRN
jgi:hypothetical protein